MVLGNIHKEYILTIYFLSNICVSVACFAVIHKKDLTILTQKTRPKTFLICITFVTFREGRAQSVVLKVSLKLLPFPCLLSLYHKGQYFSGMWSSRFSFLPFNWFVISFLFPGLMICEDGSTQNWLSCSLKWLTRVCDNPEMGGNV
jgi:hypothetical protein